MNASTVKARVDQLLAMTSQPQESFELNRAIYHGTLGVMHALYGPGSSQEKALSEFVEEIRQRTGPASAQGLPLSNAGMRGTLTSIKAELDAGFIGSLRATLTGEILTDLIKLARTTLAEPGEGAKNVAAILTAAAFEDVIRRLNALMALVEHEKLQDVITALKDASVLQGAEVGIAQSYLKFRNSALHAKWSEVDRPGIESALAFTEQIILKHLT